MLTNILAMYLEALFSISISTIFPFLNVERDTQPDLEILLNTQASKRVKQANTHCAWLIKSDLLSFRSQLKLTTPLCITLPHCLSFSLT